ncbi:MAG: ribonuclease Z [Dorea sp.]|jgi:hypothetical protein|nr:ribonuclease Z [Dorea sp.]
MIAVVCVDEKNGMMFHGRRQSQDRSLRENLLRECGEKRLYMNEYSARMFKEASGSQIIASEDFLCNAGVGEFCFVEDRDVGDFLQKLESVIVYKWNRCYPADVYFSINLTNENWVLVRTEEFRGSSHDRITKEVYQKL